MTDDVYREAIEHFGEWLNEALAADIPEPTAMTLATLGREGGVSARTVLLKAADERGFVFYTNTRSRKGRQLADDPHCALVFLWVALKRQVLVEGSARLVPEAEADAYWKTRPRESQIGARASDQSEVLQSTEALEARFAEVERLYRGREIPRPAHWTGYRVEPSLIEFWSGRDARLHQRYRYSAGPDGWVRTLLYP